MVRNHPLVDGNKKGLRRGHDCVPLIVEFENLAQDWKAQGDQRTAENAQYAATMLACLDWLAEDMGYEW